jgi:hypothetical protein
MKYANSVRKRAGWTSFIMKIMATSELAPGHLTLKATTNPAFWPFTNPSRFFTGGAAYQNSTT